jgi:hypothetical protein
MTDARVCEVIGCTRAAGIVLWHGGLQRHVAVCDEHEKDGLTVEGNRMQRQREECVWFDYCHNPATDSVDHPIFGTVLVCDTCSPIARLDASVHGR